MSVIIRSARLKNWIKNILILVPIFFSSIYLSREIIIGIFDIFIVLSLSSSIVYIFNDIIDLKDDKKDLIKKSRPLASGEISKKNIINLSIILSFILLTYLFFRGNIVLILICSVYLILNLGYSILFKKIYLIDVIILSLFYIIRVIAPVFYFDLDFSIWLVVIIFFAVMLVGFGKRYMDIKNNKSNKNFLSHYKEKELKIFIFSFSTLLIILYFMFTISDNTVSKFGELFYLSFIIFLFGTLRYLYSLLKKNYSDPIEIFTKDKILTFFVLSFGLYSFYCIYISN